MRKALAAARNGTGTTARNGTGTAVGTAAGIPLAGVVVAVLLTATLTACAPRDTTGPGTAPTAVTSAFVVLSAEAQGSRMPVAVPVPGGRGGSCRSDDASQPRVMPSPPSSPSPPSTGDEAAERRRRVLEQAASATPVPRRGAVPAHAVPGAEACVRVVVQEFNLVTLGSTRVPELTEIRTVLTSAGLTRVVVRGGAEGPVFAGWNGQACVFGGFRAATPTVGIAAPADDGTCSP